MCTLYSLMRRYNLIDAWQLGSVQLYDCKCPLWTSGHNIRPHKVDLQIYRQHFSKISSGQVVIIDCPFSFIKLSHAPQKEGVAFRLWWSKVTCEQSLRIGSRLVSTCLVEYCGQTNVFGINFCSNWLLSACAYNTRQQENMRLTKYLLNSKHALN